MAPAFRVEGLGKAPPFAMTFKGKRIPAKTLWYLTLVFIILTLAVGSAGYFYYASEKKHIEQDKYGELDAIAGLKVSQIVNWRKERMGDAVAILENPFVASRLGQWLEDESRSELGRGILAWMAAVRGHFDYAGVFLLDREGALRLAVPDKPVPVDALEKELAVRAMRTEEIVFSDIHRGEDGKILLDLLVPLLLRESGNAVPVGVLLLRVDPYRSLYPLLQEWPIPSRTGETLLIERDGNDVLFLNELRFREHTALTLKFPIQSKRLPAAMALRGVSGLVRGIDYNGMPVLAALRRIPDSPWFLVAKVSTSEIFTPIHQRAWIVLALCGAFVVIVGMSLVLFWRQLVLRQSQAELEAEAALARLRYQNELILNSAGDGIFGLDLEGNHTFVNPAAAKMLECEVEEVVGKHSHTLCHYSKADGSPYPEEECPIYAAYKDGKVRHGVDEYFWRKDGTGFPVEYTSTPIMENGRLVGAVVTFKDVTERKRTEKALQESEERYRGLFQNSHAAMLLIDPGTGDIVDANPAACAFYGYGCAELTALKITDISILPATEVFNDMRRAQERTRSHFYFKHRLANGEERDVEVFSGPIVLHGRHFLHSIIHDITERKKAEDGLKASEDRYRNLVEGARDTIHTISADGVISALNPAFEATTGWLREEWLGKPFHSLLHPEDSALAEAVLEAALRGETPPVHQWRVLQKSGECLTEEFTLTPQFRNGKVTGIICVGRDISERKQIEEERLKAGKLESIGLLAGGIAHDFNNVLTAILGNITLAKLNAKQGDKAYNLLSEAEKASLAAKALTQQLLTFSRGGVPVRKITPLHELVRDAAVFSARGSGSHCRFSMPDDLWLVEIDEGQIRQVVSNLVLNAVQSMPGGGTIHVQAENATVQPASLLPLEPGDYVRVSVSDRGIGIPQEHLSKVFDPYYTTKQKGSGLGLTICYSIIKSHAGHISVESEAGIGTTVHFYLPAAPKEEVAAERQPEELAYGRGRVLLMDDEEMVREVVGQMLGHLGYEAGFARDGAEALDLYEKARQSGRPFDAVIMDLTIPGGMGGKEAVRKLLEMDPSARVIVSSGYSSDPVMAAFSRHGFRGAVGKPFQLRELSEVLHQILAEESPDTPLT
jgi:PAS domain S-box-containing protein